MADSVQVLKDWIAREGRKQSWVAQQVGCTPQWLNYVLNGKRPLSDKLARALENKFGIPLLHERHPTTNGDKIKGQAKGRTRAKP